jgi:tetratricopeptide (TPR) repeat protein
MNLIYGLAWMVCLFSTAWAQAATSTALAERALPSISEGQVREIDEPTLDLLLKTQDALFAEDYAACEALLAKAQALDPKHPGPQIYLQSVLIYMIQTNMRAGQDTRATVERLRVVSDKAVEMATAYNDLHKSPASKLFLGGGLGTRGMGQLYLGNYIAAFKDGKRAYALLKECVAEEPRMYNAYLGLGQFEYTSGRMAGVLQYVLDLHGDEAKGLSLLETCEAKGTYAAPSAMMFLSRMYLYDQKDYDKAFHYLSKLYQRWPNNPGFTRYVLDLARQLGYDQERAWDLVEKVGVNWDQGWRPGQGFKLDFEESRMAVSEAQIKAGQVERARVNLSHMLDSLDAKLAAKARKLLEQKP